MIQKVGLIFYIKIRIIKLPAHKKKEKKKKARA